MNKRIYHLVILVLGLNLCGSTAFAQWSRISQLQNLPITCILVENDSSIFVGGYFNYLVHSTDGGNTWVSASKGIPADTIVALAADSGYIFAGTSAGIFRSSDDGQTWEESNSGILNGGSPVVQFAVTDSAIYVATVGGIFRSYDLGLSWIPTNNGLASGETPYVSYTIDPTGIVSTSRALFATQDYKQGAYVMRPGSNSWERIGLRNAWCDAGALAAVDTTVFAGTQSGIFMYAGSDTTWVGRDNGIEGSLQFCFMVSQDSLLFLYVGVYGPLYVTSDLGQQWKQVNDNAIGGASIDAMAVTRNYLFVGTATGGWRIPINDIQTSVEKNRLWTPATFTLFQNYPNPFNPTTVITYDIAKRSLVRLAIYDILGRQVVTLVNAEKSPGRYQATFNGAGLPSGVYFCRIQAGNYTGVKKLMLMK